MNTRSDFWSRRKARVTEEALAEAEEIEAAKIAQEHAALEQKTDDEVLEELGLPNPDTMRKGDDFSAFMSKAVPDRIRRRALRKLWVSNPALANLDGLLDYGEDFTDSAKVIENLQTAYQVGKGMLAHVEELARQAEAEADDAEESDAVLAEVEPSDDAEPVVDTEPVAAIETAEQDPAAQAFEEKEPDEMAYAPAPRRRMHFSFDDHAGGAT